MFEWAPIEKEDSQMVQMSDVKAITEAWRAAGSPVCEHLKLDKEYAVGMSTGDHICTACGESFTRAERAELRAGRSN